MKSFSILFGLVLSLFSAGQALAQQQCTTDSVGSAIGLIASINSTAEGMANPSKAIGDQASKMPPRLVKYFCTELGSQAAYALSIQNVLRLHSTSTCSKNYNEAPVVGQMNEIADIFTKARAKYCYGDVTDRDAMKGIQEIQNLARKQLAELSALISSKAAVAAPGSKTK